MCPIIFILHKLSFNKVPLLITEDSIKQLKNDNIVSKKFLGFENLVSNLNYGFNFTSYLKH